MTTITKLKNALEALEAEQPWHAMEDLKSVIAEMEAGEQKDTPIKWNVISEYTPDLDKIRHDESIKAASFLENFNSQPKAELHPTARAAFESAIRLGFAKPEEWASYEQGYTQGRYDEEMHQGPPEEVFAQPKAEPAQEPVAWYHRDYGNIELSRVQRVGWTPLYAAPPQAKPLPLLDAEIWNWWASENGLEDCDMTKYADFKHVVRAIESKHGIRGEK